MTSTRTANTLKDLAKVILEEQKEGRFPISYSLPSVTFSDEGERANLSPNLQAIVEENMAKLESKGKVYSLSLKGLLDVAEGKQNPEKGNDVKVKTDAFGEILLTKFNEDPNVDLLSYNDLKRLNRVLDDKCAPKETRWKYVKYKTMARLKRLKLKENI